jgi:HSP20 family protein
MRFACLLLTATLFAIHIPGVQADDGWSLGHSFFSSLLDDTTPTPFLRKSGGSHYPRYELVDDDETFQVSLEIPGATMDDVQVRLDDCGRMLVINGHREVINNDYSYRNSFSQSLSLDPTVEVEKLTATLKDGLLVVTAPKDATKARDTSRLIPIQIMMNEMMLDSGETPKEIDSGEHKSLERMISSPSKNTAFVPEQAPNKTEQDRLDALKAVKHIVEPAREIMDRWGDQLRRV